MCPTAGALGSLLLEGPAHGVTGLVFLLPELLLHVTLGPCGMGMGHPRKSPSGAGDGWVTMISCQVQTVLTHP